MQPYEANLTCYQAELLVQSLHTMISRRSHREILLLFVFTRDCDCGVQFCYEILFHGNERSVCSPRDWKTCLQNTGKRSENNNKRNRLTVRPIGASATNIPVDHGEMVTSALISHAANCLLLSGRAYVTNYQNAANWYCQAKWGAILRYWCCCRQNEII